MNTVLKSALFAAVIFFGGIYVADVVYNKISQDPAASLASLEPAAGSVDIEEVPATEASAEEEAEMMNSEDAAAAAEGEETLFEVGEEAEANNENILEVIEQEAKMMGEEANENAQEMISEMEDAMEDAAQIEPAAGGADADEKLKDEMESIVE